MSKKKKETETMSDATPATPKAPKVDFTAEIARLRAMPSMTGVADRLEEAVGDVTSKNDELKAVRRRLRKMYSGILTVLGESK